MLVFFKGYKEYKGYKGYKEEVRAYKRKKEKKAASIPYWYLFEARIFSWFYVVSFWDTKLIAR